MVYHLLALMKIEQSESTGKLTCNGQYSPLLLYNLDLTFSTM
jgi:hypothetical protein